MIYNEAKRIQQRSITVGKTKHTGPAKLDTSLKPSIWASWIPLGLGRIKPHHIIDTLKIYRIRLQGSRVFSRISWDEALNRIAAKIKQIDPKQLAFYLTARGITNEVYYTSGKVARVPKNQQYR
jgi:anaerobic selenocysteine-containing dehydrogenase